MSTDPLAGKMPDISSYAYAYNNPIMMNDPTGMEPSGGEGGGDPPSDSGGVDKSVGADNIGGTTSHSKNNEMMPEIEVDITDNSTTKSTDTDSVNNEFKIDIGKPNVAVGDNNSLPVSDKIFKIDNSGGAANYEFTNQKQTFIGPNNDTRTYQQQQGDLRLAVAKDSYAKLESDIAATSPFVGGGTEGNPYGFAETTKEAAKNVPELLATEYVLYKVW